jgi:hypothetical protein
LSYCYPHFNWEPWKFKGWNLMEKDIHCRSYLDSIAEELGIDLIQYWYRYESDLATISIDFQTLRKNYPDTQWQPWRFQIINNDDSNGYWEDPNNLISFLEYLEDKLQITDWYSCKISKLSRYFRMISRFGCDLPLALKILHPHIEWQPWNFEWYKDWHLNEENISNYFQWVQEILQIQDPRDWYNTLNLKRNKLLQDIRWKGNYRELLDSLMNTFKDSTWLFWLFDCEEFPWNFQENFRNILDWMEESLNVTLATDWHDVTRWEIDAAPRSAKKIFEGNRMKELLSLGYPGMHWNGMGTVDTFASKSQGKLTILLRRWLKKWGIEMECDWSSLFLFPNTNMHLDIWIPRYNIAIEYQAIL